MLISIIDLGQSYISDHYTANSRAYDYQGSNEDIRAILAAISEFDPLDDTIAQWIMAIFAVVAAGLSGWAVVLLRDTLTATRDTIKVTKEIGQKQTRAYLTCLGASYEVSGDWLKLALYLKNVGQSPAVACNVVGNFNSFRTTEGQDFFWEADCFPNKGERIASGETSKVDLLVGFFDAPEQIRLGVNTEESTLTGSVEIEWTDVFDETQCIVVDLFKDWDADDTAESGKRTSEWLSVRGQISYKKNS